MKTHWGVVVMMPHSDVVGYWCFGRPCCIQLQGEVQHVCTSHI